MPVRQVISQTGQPRQPSLDPAPNRLQFAKKAVFKPNPPRVGDAIDGVEREHDARRLEQEIRLADPGRSRGDPANIQVCYGRGDRRVRSKRHEQALLALTTRTLDSLGDPLWIQYRTRRSKPVIYIWNMM